MNKVQKQLSRNVRIATLFVVRLFVVLFFIATIFSPLQKVFAVTGVPEILNFQGRLLDNNGNLLGSSAGTEYCYKFAVYDASTAGTKLWPSGSPTGQSITTRLGVFDAYVGVADTLDYNFNDNDTTYMDVQVATKVGGSCTNGDESYESLTPRPQIVASAYALNSGRLEGFAPSTSTTLSLGASNPIIAAVTASAALTLDSTGGSGSVVVGSSAPTVNICSSAGCDTINIGSNADADVITIGDAASDTTSLNGVTVAIDSGDWDITTTGDITGVSFDANGTGNSITNIESADILDNTLTTDDLNATLTFADDDIINLSAINNSDGAEGLILPQNASACSAATAEGQICWDTAGEDLYVGNGTTAVQMNTGGGGSWDTIGDPSGDGTIEFASTEQLMNFTDFTTTDFDGMTFNFDNNGGTAGTDSGIVLNNAVSTNAAGDVNTENILLIQQLDTTASGTTVVDNALKIDVAANSGVTDGIEITNSAGNLTNGINIVDTVGGTLTTGLTMSGTMTTSISIGSTTTTAIDLSGGSSTTDIILDDGLTLAQTSDNDFDLVENSLTLNYDFGETTASTITGSSASSIEFESTANSATALRLESTTGGISIAASGAATGEDISIVATGSSVLLRSSEAVTDAINLQTSNAAGAVFVDGGTVDKTADAFWIDIDSNSASVDGLFIDADVGTALSAGEEFNGIHVDVAGLAGDDATALIDAVHLVGDTTSSGRVTALTLTGTFDNGINFSNATLNNFDITLDDGLTINQSSDADFELIEAGLTLNYDFGETTGSTITQSSASALEFETTANGAASLKLESTIGGIDIFASGAAAGEDIDIVATGSSVNITSTEATAGALLFTASGGTTATINLTSNGTGTAAIDIDATGVGGDIDIDANDAITIDAGGTISVNGTNFDVDTSGNLDVSGTLTAGSGNEAVTLSTGKIDSDAITLAATGGTATTSSGSGLEVVSNGLTLIQGCAEGGILEWTDAGGWACGTDSTGAGLSDGDYTDVTVSGSGTVINIDSGAVTTTEILDGTIDSDDLDLVTGDVPADGECLTYDDQAGTGDFLWASCGGGGGDLQTSYAADADGSDATISLTSGDDSLIFLNPASSGTDSAFLAQFDQANTTAGVVALDITQRSSGANALNVRANSIDTEIGINVAVNALTTGKGLSVSSSATAFTGSLASFTLSGSNASNTGNVLLIDNTGTDSANIGLKINHYATGAGNLALRIDDSSGDATPLIVDGFGRLGVGTSSISDSASSERLLQVGSETNRGNSVTYGEVVTKGLKDLTALTNIRDIYIYDTTADSDAGRWIDWATTDQLSWYSEALDDGPGDPCNIASDDRCYKSAFPRKAILVVTTDALYIFDAQDNTMWMKFSQNASGYALGVDTSNDPSSVTALNGVIYVGTNGASATGFYAIDFTSDRMWKYDSTDRSQGDVGIGSRNTAVTYNSDNNTNFDLGNDTGWDAVNDVSAAVVQFSTTDITLGAAGNFAPGNGQTLVAIATDSGLGVVNLTRQRYLAYSESTDDNYNAVAITRTAKLYGLNSTLDQAEKWGGIDLDQVSEEAGNPDKLWDQASLPALSKNTPAVSTSAPDALEVVERGSLADGGTLSTATVAGSSDLIYVGTDQGLTEIHDSDTATMGWSKFYNTTRQTPLMPGTIKRVHLMDDASGDLTDASFRANTMAPIGGVTYGVEGVRGKAVTLNGTSGFFCSDNGTAGCAVDTDDNMSTTAWSIQMWFKHSTTIAGNDVLYSKCYNTTPAAAAACVTIYMNSSGFMVGALDDDVTWTAYSSYDQMATSTRTYNDNQWHHVVLARDNANDINMYIDGSPLNLSTATGSTLTVDASQIVAIGADCSVGVACATGANFWDGSIDDFTFSQGTTTIDALNHAQVRRLYNDARPLVNKKVTTVDNATSATSTTITDTGEAWLPNEYSGQVVVLTSGTGSGQTRRVVSNTTDTLTVSPAWSTTPDTTTDFKIDPEALYGSSNTVTAIGISAEAPMGEARQLCVGTSDGADGGGVTCLNHQAGPNIVADVYHSDSEQFDDSGTEWTGGDYDDIRSIDISGRAMVMGTDAHFWTETEDVRLGQGLDYLSNKIFNLNNHIKNLGMNTLAGSGSLEIGLTGAADLAEYYYSNVPLTPGDVVAIEPSQSAGITTSTIPYQSTLLGIVSTSPALTIGLVADNAYPIALAGRVPVKVTTQNGIIKVGDELTSSSMEGFAMKATQAGPVIGKVINEPVSMVSCDADLPDISATMMSDGPGVTLADIEIPGMDGESPFDEEDEDLGEEDEGPSDAEGVIDVSDGEQCGYAMVFVGISDSLGENIAHLAEEHKLEGEQDTEIINGLEVPVLDDGTIQGDIMTFLRHVKEGYEDEEIELKSLFTDRVASAVEILTPSIFADEVTTRNIKNAQGQDISVSLLSGGRFVVKDDTGAEKTIFNSLGDALFSGTVSAGTLVATVIESPVITALDERIVLLEEMLGSEFNTFNTFESITTGALTASGLATFSGESRFEGLSFFNNSVSFSGDVEFGGVVEFLVPPLFSRDTAGFAIINEGDTNVEIVFEEPYIATPIVNVNMTFEALDNIDDISLGALFNEDYRFVVYNKSVEGFTVILNKPAERNIRFSWVALGVNDPTIFESVFDGLTLDEPEEDMNGEEETPAPEDIPELQVEEVVDEGGDTSSDTSGGSEGDSSSGEGDSGLDVDEDPTIDVILDGEGDEIVDDGSSSGDSTSSQEGSSSGESSGDSSDTGGGDAGSDASSEDGGDAGGDSSSSEGGDSSSESSFSGGDGGGGGTTGEF